MGLVNWIKCGNDCTKCNQCWDERTSYEYDEWECGCYIKGSDFDDKRCYLINPLKFIIGSLKQKKYRYYSDHEYDGFAEFSQEQDSKCFAMGEAIEKNLLDGYYICMKINNELHECDKEQIIMQNSYSVMQEYENAAHHNIKTTLRTRWNVLIKETFNFIMSKTLYKLKPYFCK